MSHGLYPKAIALLNSLQKRPPALAKLRQGRSPFQRSAEERGQTLVKIQRTLVDIGCDISRLRVVHIGGTKGKGSTCLYVDALLNHHRRRFSINGQPISEEQFSDYFFQLWHKIYNSSNAAESRQLGYFSFLTCLSFFIFINEKVTIAVYETGIGGEFGATSILPDPVVTALTSLGIDHISQLGSTIEDVAREEAGIFRPGRAAFTVFQPEEALVVVRNRALEKGAIFRQILDDPRLGHDFMHSRQAQNASLAVAICEEVLACEIPEAVITKLPHMRPPGRSCTVPDSKVTWWLDIAHTRESLEVATEWFVKSTNSRRSYQILVFNHESPRRDGKQLLDALYDALSPYAGSYPGTLILTKNELAVGWKTPDLINYNVDPRTTSHQDLQNVYADHWRTRDPEISIHNSDDINAAISLCRGLDQDQVDAFVTGDAHMVGSMLSVFKQENLFAVYDS